MLTVLDPGLYTLLVDFGRPRTRSLGVPIGGAADRTSLILGNALVGNPPDTPALEITLKGPSCRTNCELAGVVFGAGFDVRSNQRPLRAGTTFTLRAEEILNVGSTGQGLRAYFCVRGGFDAKPVLDSCSGLEPLTSGQELGCRSARTPARFIRPELEWNSDPFVLRVLPGTQADWFPNQEFYDQEFTTTPASNRMGLRLRGKELAVAARELVSEPVCPGAVQVTRGGQCIVLGVDGQTIGGYPKIAQVITADLDKIGQLRPDDRVRFAAVSMDQAVHIHRQKQREIEGWLTRLRIYREVVDY